MALRDNSSRRCRLGTVIWMSTVESDRKPPFHIVNKAPNYGFQGIAYAPVTIHQYPHTERQQYTSEQLAEAARQLLQLPIDSVPDATPLPNGSRMPFRANIFFTGRQRTFLRTARALVADPAKEGRAIIISGIGGIGKTQFASEVVHRYGQYFGGGVAWINFAHRDAIPDQIIACGRGTHSQLDFDQLSREDKIAAVVADWESQMPRLLIFDNCEEEALLLDWLPRTGESRVLITAQKIHWGRDIRVLELRELKRPQSIALLHKLSENVSECFDAIADELGDLPLALYLAGSFLHTYRHHPLGSPESYLDQIRSAPPLEHPSLTGAVDNILPTEHDRRIAQTFELSFGRLAGADQVDVMSKALLGRCSFLAPGLPIPREFL